MSRHYIAEISLMATLNNNHPSILIPLNCVAYSPWGPGLEVQSSVSPYTSKEATKMGGFDSCANDSVDFTAVSV